MKNLPQRLAAWRKRYQLSPEAAAVRLGVSASTLFRWEHALAKPTNANQIAAVDRVLAEDLPAENIN